MSDTFQIVGLIVVKNEEYFIERVVRNISDFCDRIIVCDNQSTDDTPRILDGMKKEIPHMECHLIEDMSESHEMVAKYAGSHTWVFAVDGDEIYDASGLVEFRKELERGDHDHTFSFYGHCLHVEQLNYETRTAEGYLTPEAKSCTKLYNFSAITEWKGCRNERLHGGEIRFKDGWHYDLKFPYMNTCPWEKSLFRCLHLCFLKRSSQDGDGGQAAEVYARPNIVDLKEADASVSPWKLEQYRKGDKIEISTKPFEV